MTVDFTTIATRTGFDYFFFFVGWAMSARSVPSWLFVIIVGHDGLLYSNQTVGVKETVSVNSRIRNADEAL